MSRQLPQLGDRPFLTDGGLETTLVFLCGFDLPAFASFPLLETTEGRAALTDYFESYLSIAERDDRGIVLETPTWRSNPEWGASLGYSLEDLDRLNQEAVRFVREICADREPTVVVSGNLGPRGDGYVVGEMMSPDEAAAYHRHQIQSFVAAGADLITVLTITYTEEAIGIVRAASDAGLPVVVAFTVETDGRLPSGEALADAIARVDAATDSAAAYFMVNCAHPTHFLPVLSDPGAWHRVRGVRANASRASHEELDNSEELDRGDEAELAEFYLELRRVLPDLAVVGGCCGTDHHHIDAISRTFPTS